MDESTLPAPQNNRFCFNYLMASCCSFGTRCKYQHLPLTEAPINVLEYFVVSATEVWTWGCTTTQKNN